MLENLKHIGPGAIVASATIGAGETVLAVRVGAWGGYDLLWLILLAAVTKSFLTLYLLGRYAVMSGEAVADRLVNFPGPRGWVLWTVLVLEALVAPLVFVVIAVPCGQLMSQVLAAGGATISYKWLALGFVSLAIGVSPFGALLIGALASAIGTANAVAANAVVSLVLLGLVVIVMPSFWRDSSNAAQTQNIAQPPAQNIL